ncbi:RNA-directed DNA polymerase, partial [Vibrio campbellii]
MEQICSSTNLNQALRRVKKNKGCAGVDKLDI